MTAERRTACHAWQHDVGAWVVAQIDPARERLFDAHRAECDACRHEAASLAAVAAVALGVDPARGRLDETEPIDAPESDLAARIGSAIASERRRRRARRLAAVAAAAAGVTAGAVLAVAALRDPEPRPLRGEAVAFSVVPQGAAAAAVIAADGEGSIVQLVADGLDPGVTYALWLTRPGGTWDDRVPAGTFRPDAGGHVDVRLRCASAPDEYGRVWATTPDGEIALHTTNPR